MEKKNMIGHWHHLLQRWDKHEVLVKIIRK